MIVLVVILCIYFLQYYESDGLVNSSRHGNLSKVFTLICRPELAISCRKVSTLQHYDAE